MLHRTLGRDDGAERLVVLVLVHVFHKRFVVACCWFEGSQAATRWQRGHAEVSRGPLDHGQELSLPHPSFIRVIRQAGVLLAKNLSQSSGCFPPNELFCFSCGEPTTSLVIHHPLGSRGWTAGPACLAMESKQGGGGDKTGIHTAIKNCLAVSTHRPSATLPRECDVMWKDRASVVRGSTLITLLAYWQAGTVSTNGKDGSWRTSGSTLSTTIHPVTWLSSASNHSGPSRDGLPRL